jgi:hypothetical protein
VVVVPDRESRLLIGNLDCEVEMAGGRRLPAHVRALISRAALDMAVLADPGDRLWTPEPVDAELPGIVLESGPLAELAPADRVIAWGETGSVVSLRRGLAFDAAGNDARAAVWASIPTPEASRRCNHRSFAFELAGKLGIALAGSALVRSVDELERLIARGVPSSSARSEWVAKAPLSAAGRDRVRRRSGTLDEDARIRLGRLLALHGELVFEPWMDRIEDYGCAGVVTLSGVRLFPPHRLLNNPNGVFRGIKLLDRPFPELSSTALEVGRALATAGYHGPFGIDAYTYRDRDDDVRLHPLSEINARLTHGLLAAIRCEALLSDAIR